MCVSVRSENANTKRKAESEKGIERKSAYV